MPSQDVRGRCDSDGEWEPFANEGPDGYDTIEWIARQPWCTGKVGMMGGSYGGYVQDIDLPVLHITGWFDGDQWGDEETWPPAGTRLESFYFHSGGHANTLGGDGTLTSEAPAGEEPGDAYTYDPDDPTPSNQDLAGWPFAEEPLDRRWRQRRDDVLVYTSDPLETDLEITGHPYVVLYAASDCPDTDWHVTLCDVLPDGKAEELSTGCLRAAYRDGLDARPTAIEPGKVYEYRIELLATSNLWQKGHRLRVTVASANFPWNARNPNTNARAGNDDTWQVAHNTVCHTVAHPSHLLAPVVRS